MQKFSLKHSGREFHLSYGDFTVKKYKNKRACLTFNSLPSRLNLNNWQFVPFVHHVSSKYVIWEKKKYNNIDENIWQSNVSYMQMLLEFNRAEKIKNASTCNVYLIRRHTVLRNILMDNKWCFISCVYDTKPNHQESKQLQVLGNWLQTWTRFLFPSQV